MKKDDNNLDRVTDDFDSVDNGNGNTHVGYMERLPIEGPLTFPDEVLLIRTPMIIIPETCAFPEMPISIPMTIEENEEVASRVLKNGSPVVLLYVDSDNYEPGKTKGVSHVGVLSYVVKKINGDKSGRGTMLFCICGPRVRVTKFNVSVTAGKRTATLKYYPITIGEDMLKVTALMQLVSDRFDQLMSHEEHPIINASELYGTMEPAQFICTLVFHLPVSGTVKNQILECHSFEDMCECVLGHLDNLIRLMEIKTEITDRTNREIDQQQKEAYIQHQIANLQKEINLGGEADSIHLRKRSAEKKWTEETRNHFNRELAKLERYPSNSPDYSIQYSYLDYFLNLPWQEYAEGNYDLKNIENVLNKDHFGLEKVKERISEQMAVAYLRKDNKSPIICLVGPPGVGKTSLGRSIARAIGRDYVRVSFGGLQDEAEIRGHRRTYIGAMPGRIISSLAKKKTSNPVMVLDEIDKIGKNFKGDPSTALLEVLDPEQNSQFHDNYLDADYDLSNVMFIATANTLESISTPLRDRMEIISIPGYITAEKVEIAINHLIPKQIRENGLDDKEIEFEKDAIEFITDYYTRESGVRKLEKMIAKVLRRIAVLKVKGEEYPKIISREIARDLLGKIEFNPDTYENNDFIGVVTGLAWTQVGGEILFIESSITDGKGKLTLTGNLGDVMKESATIALQYLRSHSDLVGKEATDFDKLDFHIHVPEGAIPKDGPSAGVTMATSLASALSGRKVKEKLAMTGEITLRGKVLPVGGIKEKIIAAKRAGIKEIILSVENEKDIAEVNPAYLEGLTFSYVRTIKDVLDKALI